MADLDIILEFQRQNEPVSVGTHRLTIAKIEPQPGKEFPYLRVSYKVLTKGEEGRQLVDNISLSPQARFRLDEWLDAVGAPTTGRGRPELFIGKTLRAEVGHEEFEGRTRPRPNKYFPDSGPMGGSGVAAPEVVRPPQAPVPVPRASKSLAEAVKED